VYSASSIQFTKHVIREKNKDFLPSSSPMHTLSLLLPQILVTYPISHLERMGKSRISLKALTPVEKRDTENKSTNVN
jgi:hypothetical protein